MLQLDQAPFNYLPVQGGDLFDLTCEYMISLLDRLQKLYVAILSRAEKITQELPNANFESYRECFVDADMFVDQYARLVKVVKLSLGEDVGRVSSKQKIFDVLSYQPNAALQEKIVHGFRNTQQHFEERLQDYHTQLDPFIELSYGDSCISWAIRFGSGGYRHTGSGYDGTCTFDKERLRFHSYIQQTKQIKSESIGIEEVLQDAQAIGNLLKENLDVVIKAKGICCPPPRNVSVFMR